jgi:hypothetical protein
MKLLLGLLLLLLVAAGGALFYLHQWGLTIYLTEEELQQRVEEPFPIEQRHFRVVGITLSDPRVSLREGNDRLHYEMRARASVTGIGDVLDVRALISGTVRYQPREAAFFLDDFRIEELDTRQVPSMQREWVREGVGIAVREALRRQPLYRLQPGDPRQAAAILALRDVRVVDQRLRIRLRLGFGAEEE